MEKLFQNIHKNIMGTISFDAKFVGMRKAQDFIVYPITEENQDFLNIQSENRFARIDIKNKFIHLSGNHNYANQMKLAIDINTGKAKNIKINNEENFLELLQAIQSTGSKNLVGDSFVKTDNSGALSICSL